MSPIFDQHNFNTLAIHIKEILHPICTAILDIHGNSVDININIIYQK